MRHLTKAFATLCTLLFLSPSYADTYQFKPFRADYTVTRHGDKIGKATRILRKTETGYHLDFNSDVSLFVLYDKRKESCEVKQIGDILQSQYYQTDIKSIVETSKRRTDFNWQTLQITNTASNKSYTFKDPTYDLLCNQLQLKWDLIHKRTPLSYTLFDEDEFKTYNYTHLGTVKLSTELGEVETVKLVLKRGSRETYVWLGIQQDYIPIQIQQFRKGDEVLMMRIKKVQFN